MGNSSQAHMVTDSAALQEWTHHVESVLRGIAHSMNNRAAALAAVVELSRDPDDDAEATRQILEDEAVRIQELVRVIRLVGPPGETVEALAPEDLVRDAQQVLALHAELRDRDVRIHAAGAPPVRVQRALFLRALVALAAATTPGPDKRSIEIRMTGDGEWLAVQPVTGISSSTYAAIVARAMGGEALPAGGGFRIPTLEALRRREGRSA